MSLVIDADGHVEETLPELVDAIPSAMRDSALHFVTEADGYVTYRIEGRLWRSKYPFPGGLQNHVSAGGMRREGGRDPKVRLQVLDECRYEADRAKDVGRNDRFGRREERLGDVPVLDAHDAGHGHQHV